MICVCNICMYTFELSIPLLSRALVIPTRNLQLYYCLVNCVESTNHEKFARGCVRWVMKQACKNFHIHPISLMMYGNIVL